MFVALALTVAIPAADAQPAPPVATRAPGDSPSEAQSAQEREVLAAADQLASDASAALERWISTQAISEDRLFSRMYFPVPKTSPQKYTTPYDMLAERDFVGIEDKALARGTSFQYAIVTDSNAYIPAHNTRFAQPLTGNAVQDYANNRTKRMLGTASLIAGRSEARYLILRTKLETGDVIYDLSVPIVVRGKHWGCARVGYRRAE
jgi:methyl-accepting chemotaxis protein